jgi:PBSX family phage terminase large subunit
LARNVLDVIADILPGAISYTRGATTCRIFGRLVHVLGANDARAESRLRGLTLAGAYVDEITLLPEAFFVQLLGRLSVPGARLFGSTNPDNPAHWFKKRYLDRAAELDMYVVHFELADNPSLAPAYVAALAAEFTGLWWKRFIKGLWVSADGAIYDMLDDTLHCRPAPPKTLWRAAWISVDYGTSNPTHALLTVLSPDSAGLDTLHTVTEWEHDGRARGQLTDAEISRRLGVWAADELADTGLAPITVLDPSAASLRVQMRADGWAGLRSADNRVDVGIRATASLISGGRLLTDKERCPMLWDQMCGYVWDEKALLRGVEQPSKVGDHGPDARRYQVMAARSVWRQWLPELAAATDLQAAA